MQSNRHTLRAVLLTLVLAASAAPPVHAGEPATLTHVHGLSYSPDGQRLMIPSHFGLAVFENGRWSKAPGPAHDYMGFSATRDALYSSGHPAPGSGLTNPFGLIKSRNGGSTWQKLGLEGESDFHTLATGYDTNVVYVVNQAPNSRMEGSGIFHTSNDGLTWTYAAAEGLNRAPASLAVHPADAATVAAGTDDGLYLSRDWGASFERMAGGMRVLAVAFDMDRQHLWFSTYAGKTAGLARIALIKGAKADVLPIPPLTEDAVTYIAQNPVRRSEIAIATFQRSVFLSNDQGRTWTELAQKGVTHE